MFTSVGPRFCSASPSMSKVYSILLESVRSGPGFDGLAQGLTWVCLVWPGEKSLRSDPGLPKSVRSVLGSLYCGPGLPKSILSDPGSVWSGPVSDRACPVSDLGLLGLFRRKPSRLGLAHGYQSLFGLSLGFFGVAQVTKVCLVWFESRGSGPGSSRSGPGSHLGLFGVARGY